LGPYGPAGPNWQRAIRTERTRSLLGVEIESPDPEQLAERWASIFEWPVQKLGNGRCRIPLEAGTIEIVPSTSTESVFAGVNLEVADQAAIFAAAKAQGCSVGHGTVSACGMRFRIS
jgi:hypothetical protein